MLQEQLLDTWDIHNRMLFMLFDAIPPTGFEGKPQGMSGRGIGNIFAHLHNTRLTWIEVAAPSLSPGLNKIPTRTKADKAAITPEILRPALVSSAQAMRELLKTGFEKGKLKNLKPHLVGSFSYFIAHEWYHLGEIGMTLTQSGHKLDDTVAYGIWAWDRWQPGQKQSEEHSGE